MTRRGIPSGCPHPSNARHRMMNHAANIKQGGFTARQPGISPYRIAAASPRRNSTIRLNHRRPSVRHAPRQMRTRPQEPQSGPRLMLTDIEKPPRTAAYADLPTRAAKRLTLDVNRRIYPSDKPTNRMHPKGMPPTIKTMSYTKNYQHIVFATKYRHPTIPEESKRIMLKFIHELCNRQNWHLVRINAYLDHMHILIDIPPTVLIPDVVKLIKVRTTQTFKHHLNFPDFEGWGKSYGAFSVSHIDRQPVIDYIANQENHHANKSFGTELESLLLTNGITPDEYIDLYNSFSILNNSSLL